MEPQEIGSAGDVLPQYNILLEPKEIAGPDGVPQVEVVATVSFQETIGSLIHRWVCHAAADDAIMLSINPLINLLALRDMARQDRGLFLQLIEKKAVEDPETYAQMQAASYQWACDLALKESEVVLERACVEQEERNAKGKGQGKAAKGTA